MRLGQPIAGYPNSAASTDSNYPIDNALNAARQADTDSVPVLIFALGMDEPGSSSNAKYYDARVGIVAETNPVYTERVPFYASRRITISSR